ncbi:2Fe-2S iron-sulfur cluster-binding protein [Gammaproteobacteria bacterium AS21]
MNRLNSPMGLLIDRSKSISFSFEGKQFQGLEGDTLASALAANQQWLMSRSFKYHRPRGPLTMAGQDANTLVQLQGEPNVLADRIAIKNGLIATGQNCNGSLANDSDSFLGHFSRFMPVGFYYRSFYKMPFSKYKDSWKYWEPTIRKKAGLGELDLTFKPEYYDKEYLFYDVVVVGSGPAGLNAAITAAQAGATVLLVEEQPVLGGSLTYHRFDEEGVQALALKEQLLTQVAQNERIKVLVNASCNGWFTDNYLPVIQGNRMFKVRARECIVASGSFEQHVVFRNNDLPGIMMSSAAMRLMKHYAVKPGDNAVVLTGNDDGYLTALELLEQGVKVAAVVDMREDKDIASQQCKVSLSAHNIEVFTGHTVYEAIASKGNKKVKGVNVRSITGQGEVSANGFKIDCDLLCMSAGYMPVYQLLCQAGAQLSYDDQGSEFSLKNLPAHLHIAGSVNAIHDLTAVLNDGERAAINALHNIGLALDKVLPSVECQRRVNFHWPIFSHPKGKDFVDFDEDLQARDIVNATRLGYRDIQLVKRFSTVGMGPSQGRHSALPTARLVADATDRNVTQTGVTTARPPFSPEKLAHLAGRIFDPYRRTTMHRRHLALGAKMMPAGNWQRPAFYGQAKDRDQCMQDESVHVRTKVGIIDVSTLGGIELRGPDAAELMNRIFTFAFLKQPVGKTRYAVLTNEHGVVIDDGVSCRISDEHFYVTATTSGVENVYREMLRWNAQWRLDVDISNVTSALSAVNVAGPDARKVLELLVDDIDLSSEAFPYLAYREGHVGQIPARFLRVGFVGELGFEIHVPARYGEALWDMLMEAGKAFDIRPFGVETQRLLRLEKGHIIVSQDTDSMSHPGELSLDWAISRKKPFFIGRRSIDILQAQPQSRKLVGFKLPAHIKVQDQPKEGHLVLADNNVTSKITGNITSCEYSPSLDMTIGMAFAGINQCALGDSIYIKVDSGELIKAEVVKLPFYDPDNLRQQM